MATTAEDRTQAQPLVRPRGRVRDRIIPRSVLGLSALILFTALGAAFSGAVLYTYYQYKLDQNEKKVTALAGQTKQVLDKSKDIIDAETDNAKKEIQEAMGPLKQLAASEETLNRLIDGVKDSVWFVHTQDEAGQASAGTAFVVASDGDQSFLVTSYAAVRAATRSPGPGVFVRKGGDDLKATVWTWQPERDLALLIVDRPNLPKVKVNADRGAVKLGERVFAVSGLGGSGASIVQGQVADVFAEGIQHTAPVGQAFRGGPLIDSNGAVVGVTSADYGPLGFFPGDVTWAVPINRTCERILRCPNGQIGGAAGNRGG
ncbi:MAG TPA: serine protease [Acidimicrobiales bacterium]|jgi:S1-C subfamily serine protease|nr:serine protease [Acidimicrobiales bacterium]